MYLDSEKKKEIFGTYGKSNTDTGSPEAQIALFSVRIAHLTEHLKVNKKDYNTQRSLKMLVGKRRRLLDYLMRKDINRYRAIISKNALGIRQYSFKRVFSKRIQRGTANSAMTLFHLSASNEGGWHS